MSATGGEGDRPIDGLSVQSREAVFSGEVVDLSVVHYRRPGGLVVRREVIGHPGAVVMVPVEGDHVLMVRQPREEVGRAAGTWEDWGGFYTAPAILEEYIHCFLATDLRAVDHEPIPEEEIEVVPWPLADLAALIATVHDAKSLIGLLRLQHRIVGIGAP